jgi:hypothetical protein
MVLQMLARVGRDDRTKDVELLVLRHHVAVPRCKRARICSERQRHLGQPASRAA